MRQPAGDGVRAADRSTRPGRASGDARRLLGATAQLWTSDPGELVLAAATACVRAARARSGAAHDLAQR